MNKCICYIGIIYDYRDYIVDLDGLLNEGDYALKCLRTYKNKSHMYKFNFCPDCGDKIDWIGIKKKVKSHLKKINGEK